MTLRDAEIDRVFFEKIAPSFSTNDCLLLALVLLRNSSMNAGPLEEILAIARREFPGLVDRIQSFEKRWP